ncbi:MAG: hypothetical protein QM606_07865 [Leucobacter sp.]
MRKRTGGPRGAGAREEPRESALASGWTVQGDADPEPPSIARLEDADVPLPAADEPGVSEDSDAALAADERPQLSNAALVLLGVTGGLYLLYAWVWLSWAQYYAEVNAELASTSGALGAVLQQIVFWAAPLAPPLWFLAVLLLNRGRSTWRMALWIGIGAVVLLPLPVFAGGGA